MTPSCVCMCPFMFQKFVTHHFVVAPESIICDNHYKYMYANNNAMYLK